MALVAWGFGQSATSGPSITEQQYARSAMWLGYESIVPGYQYMRLTYSPGQGLKFDISPGPAYAYGVTVDNTTIYNANFTALTSSTKAWYLFYLERDWRPSPGGTAAYKCRAVAEDKIGTLTRTPGTLDEQPLWLVEADNNTIYQSRDVRLFPEYRTWAVDAAAIHASAVEGTVLVANGAPWRKQDYGWVAQPDYLVKAINMDDRYLNINDHAFSEGFTLQQPATVTVRIGFRAAGEEIRPVLMVNGVRVQVFNGVLRNDHNRWSTHEFTWPVDLGIGAHRVDVYFEPVGPAGVNKFIKVTQYGIFPPKWLHVYRGVA